MARQLMTKLEILMLAVTYAEEGEKETAQAVLQGQIPQGLENIEPFGCEEKSQSFVPPLNLSGSSPLTR
jgi:hypothetical protein